MDEEFTDFKNEAELKMEASFFFFLKPIYQEATPGLYLLLYRRVTISGETNGTPPLSMPKDNIPRKFQTQPKL